MTHSATNTFETQKIEKIGKTTTNFATPNPQRLTMNPWVHFLYNDALKINVVLKNLILPFCLFIALLLSKYTQKAQ